MAREGNLDAPTRHPLDWQNPEFYSEEALHKEMERVFDICHGCRRCISLCQSFPTLFDLVDASESMEVDDVRKEDYWQVVDHCYLCDLCYMTKCPYVPPHQWNLDFPHLMLRHKEGGLATDFKQPLGKVAYHAACHQRVQNIGPKTKEALSLVPGTEVDIIERCSGHDGTYAVKKEFHQYAMKIVKPVVPRINDAKTAKMTTSKSTTPVATQAKKPSKGKGGFAWYQGRAIPRRGARCRRRTTPSPLATKRKALPSPTAGSSAARLCRSIRVVSPGSRCVPRCRREFPAISRARHSR